MKEHISRGLYPSAKPVVIPTVAEAQDYLAVIGQLYLINGVLYEGTGATLTTDTTNNTVIAAGNGLKFQQRSGAVFGGTTEQPGSYAVSSQSATVAFAGGATEVIDFGTTIPTGAVLLGAQLRNNTILTATTGVTYSAAYSGGATASIGSGIAFAKNTKTQIMFDANAATAITSGDTDITLTPNAGTLDTGTVEATIYFAVMTAMGDAA